MPNVLAHTLLADRTLERWCAAGTAPFDGTDPRCRAAFVHGALGPDLGYFPGTDRFLSELAHRLRTGRMAARLMARASSDLQHAFACGWITHMLCDTVVHPIVETEVAAITGGAAAGSAPDAAIDLAHIRIEVGLDGVLLASYPELGRRLPAVFAARDLGFLARAFADVYGLHVSREELHTAHLSVAHWHRCLVPLVRWMTADWSDDATNTGRFVAPLLRANDGGWLRYVGAGPVAAAFISPLRPSPNFSARVEAVLHSLDTYIDDAVRHPWALEDLDMEDGAPIREQQPKARTAWTMMQLKQRISDARKGQGSYSDTPRKPMTKAMVMSAISSMP